MTLSHVLHQFVCAVTGDDGHVDNPMEAQAMQDAIDDRAAGDFKKRLVGVVGEWSHALAVSGCKNECFYFSCLKFFQGTHLPSYGLDSL